MQKLSFATFLLYAITVSILHLNNCAHSSAEYSIETNEVHSNVSCGPYETQCPTGCCPFMGATCCSDGIWCCPNGKTCIPYTGICIGIETENKKPSLVSSKPALVRKLITTCPNGTTECGKDKCCLLPHAVCCEDGEHCCPNGYRCDVQQQRCEKDFNLMHSIPSTNQAVWPYQTFSIKPYKSCPGGYMQCPSELSCCLKDEGSWSCCPKPSLKTSYTGGNNCCGSIFGTICCAGLCTLYGCLP